MRARRDFAELSRARQRRCGSVWVRHVTDPSGEVRVAYAIGRSVGPAVVRNRVRRRLRAVVRECSPALEPGLYLVGARPGAVGESFATLRDDLRSCLGAGPR